MHGTDRAGGAGQQGTQRLPRRLSRLGLRVDKRIGARLTKCRRGELPAGVTVNTGGVNEELARDVFWDTFVEVGHAHFSCHSPRYFPLSVRAIAATIYPAQ